MEGRVIIFSAPSGAGKTSIVKDLLNRGLPLEFSVSAASRNKRAGEVHGKDYYFLDAREFKRKIENDEFLEWEEVYPDYFYGTLKSELERIWKDGNHVIFEVDVKGGLKLKHKFGNQALAIFVMPPSINELERRLRARSSETEEDLRKRLSRAREEIAQADHFDAIVTNSKLDEAKEQSYQLVFNFINQASRNQNM